MQNTFFDHIPATSPFSALSAPVASSVSLHSPSRYETLRSLRILCGTFPQLARPKSPLLDAPSHIPPSALSQCLPISAFVPYSPFVSFSSRAVCRASVAGSSFVSHGKPWTDKSRESKAKMTATSMEYATASSGDDDEYGDGEDVDA